MKRTDPSPSKIKNNPQGATISEHESDLTTSLQITQIEYSVHLSFSLDTEYCVTVGDRKLYATPIVVGDRKPGVMPDLPAPLGSDYWIPSECKIGYPHWFYLDTTEET